MNGEDFSGKKVLYCFKNYISAIENVPFSVKNTSYIFLLINQLHSTKALTYFTILIECVTVFIPPAARHLCDQLDAMYVLH